MRYLKTGLYFVNLLKGTLAYMDGIKRVDCTGMVKNFTPFTRLECDVHGDTIKLVNLDYTGFVFIRPPKLATTVNVPVEEVINFNIPTIIQEGNEMKTHTILGGNDQKELTAEERMKAAKELVEEVQKELDDEKKYNDYKVIGNEIAVMIKAFNDAGLTHEEAKDFVMLIWLTQLCSPSDIMRKVLQQRM